MQFKNHRISILYGSQTGNAQDVAERIWTESKRFYFAGKVMSMDDYNVPELIQELCVIFVCSTTGQGEEPDNMKTFWKFLLRKSLPPDSLVNLKFAVLGLGDSSYTKFNFTAKRLHKRLTQLGGESLVPLGLGDDQHDLGYDAVTDPWIETLWSKLLTVFPLPIGLSPLSKNQLIVPRWGVVPSNDTNNKIIKNQSIYYSVRKSNDFTITVLENNRITHQDHFQDVRLIKLKTDGQEYQPGDVISLRPKNLPWQVREFQAVLSSNGFKLRPDTLLSLEPNESDVPVPEVLTYKVTFQQLCEEYFDLMSIPRRRTFNILAQLTDSELEREKCLEFTTAEGQEDLYAYVNRPRRTVTEVLADFPNATKNLTTEMLFELLPPVKARDFSIASSYKASKNEIHVLLAVVKYKTKLVKERLGLCSNFLAELKPGDRLTAWLKKGSFRFPRNSDANVIMVGPGTGVAPFRNYIWERVSEGTASREKLILFFGCRGKDLDFHCRDDFLKFEEENKLNLICAFSRDQDRKIYVQDKILEKKKLIWELLQSPSCYIFIAGSSKSMPQEVRSAFLDVCETCGGFSREESERFISLMEKQNRYQTECW